MTTPQEKYEALVAAHSALATLAALQGREMTAQEKRHTEVLRQLADRAADAEGKRFDREAARRAKRQAAGGTWHSPEV